MGFPCGSAGKESACSAGDLDGSLGWDDPLEKGKATHSSILAWRIPWTGITLSNFLFSLASESTPNFLSKYSLGAYYIVSSILDGFTTI